MTLLPELRKELYAVAGQHARLGAGVSRGRRWRHSVNAALVLGLAVVVVGVVAAIVLSAHSGGLGRASNRAGGFVKPPPGWTRIVTTAHRQVQSRDPACRPRPYGKRFLSGRPDRVITSSLSVFRDPATVTNRVSVATLRKLRVNGRGIYIRYARHGEIDHVGYYLIPVASTDGLRPAPTRCGNEWLTEVRKLVRQRLAVSERRRAIELARQSPLAFPPTAGVCRIDAYGEGTGQACEPMAWITGYAEDSGSEGSNTITITPLVLPDNVATATANYSTEHQVGHVAHQVITKRVRDNIVIFRITGGWDPPSITLRSATGAVLFETPQRP